LEENKTGEELTMNERQMIGHYQGRFELLMEGTDPPNERAALARSYQREIERAGRPLCLDDLHRGFRAIEVVARAINRAAQEAGRTYRCNIIREKLMRDISNRASINRPS
jgi:hypothetical protein